MPWLGQDPPGRALFDEFSGAQDGGVEDAAAACLLTGAMPAADVRCPGPGLPAPE
ncbi:hypothetical protein [Streptomyces lomondensis]|uniref:Uncharacterized protein n=1 Tax=Streptomyces lomondensis TaxID=68229 RepID=A0ABQ2XB03_9ACTN|nr:hypothetical protein [Streptomyces lomondensis]MCF0077010.1 hypothetical protein [Streptomyces lomondensis]GGX07363.1 hypothetical protein GCM10010383_41900 [Streptomyces lomondensis]